MSGAITDVAGIAVGHAQDMDRLTGCTVVLAPDGATVGVDVRGLAPATRETDLCRPGTLVQAAHAIFLTGGSAFGLDAAGGVMRYLHERGIGFETGITAVPIVPGAAIFDLGIGSIAWPDAEMAYRACEGADSRSLETGTVGAGTGATVGKLLGPERAMKSGIGSAAVKVGDVTVAALIVVNAMGDVVRPGGTVVAGARREVEEGETEVSPAVGNTTIGVIATDAALTSEQVNHLASIGHDGLARTIEPVHTLFDGDTLFALATGRVEELPPNGAVSIAIAAVSAVEQAVLDAVLSARAAGGLPAASEQV